MLDFANRKIISSFVELYLLSCVMQILTTLLIMERLQSDKVQTTSMKPYTLVGFELDLNRSVMKLQNEISSRRTRSASVKVFGLLNICPAPFNIILFLTGFIVKYYN